MDYKSSPQPARYGAQISRRATRTTLALTVTTWVLVNLPLIVVLAEHFPSYDSTLLSIIGIAPGQYLFLLLCFPFIAFFTFSSVAILVPFCGPHLQNKESPAYGVSRLFVLRQWLVALIGVLLGVLAAVADVLGTSESIDGLSAKHARTASTAHNAILRAIEYDSPPVLVERIFAQQRTYPSLSLRRERVEPIAGEKDDRLQKNKRIIRETTIQVANALSSSRKRIVDLLATSSARLREPTQERASEDNLLDAIVFLQIALTPQFSRTLRIPHMLFRISNSIELTVNVVVGWYVFFATMLLFGLRRRLYMKSSLPGPLTRVAAFLAFAIFLLSLFPPLRVYTMEEINLVYPQSTSIPGPVAVYVFCIGIAAYLIVTFLRGEIIQMVVLLGGQLVSLAYFVITVLNIFFVRELVGSAATAGSLIMILIVGISLFGAISYSLWLIDGER